MAPRWPVLAFLLATLVAAQGALAQTQTAVEYYYADWDHYFMTSSPGEIAWLDGGAFGGVWKRTGQTFVVRSQPAADVAPTCRFFSTTFAPRSSHFYTPFEAECELVKHNPNWQFEEIAFYLLRPDASGACAAGATSLYRLFNNGMGGAPNHRYTTSPAIFADMQAKGWVGEWFPGTGASACVEPSGLVTPTGVWTGTTSANQNVRAVILEDGTYFILYTPPNSTEEAGVVQGTSTSADGTFASTDGRDYQIGLRGEPGRPGIPITITGTYVPHGTLELTIAPSGLTLSATYDASAEKPASLAPAVGTYAGYSGHSNGTVPRVLTLSMYADGSVAGSNELCSFVGAATPHPSLDVFTLTLTGLSGGCVIGTSTLSGLMTYDDALHRIRGFTPFDTRGDQYYVLGNKQ